MKKRLDCAHAASGSLSEAATVFDAGRLIEIVQELGGPLPPIAKDARLRDVTLTKTLTLVDATLIKVLPHLMAAPVLKRGDGQRAGEVAVAFAV